ncbi:MAG: hypothetical protein D4R67_07645 [Bacteroidetes bacterium]|nr:MAG: hypothetical protein D4R67_07645 [Bacteroidota bacterium]
MKKRTRWIFLIGLAIILAAVVVMVVIRYVPWHKFMKMPTSNEMAFIQKDPLQQLAPNTLQFDFEVDSSRDVPNGIYKGIAHSGNYSAKAFGKNSFSVSVVRAAGEIGLENLNGVAMSAWVYAFPTENEVNGSLVFAVNNSVGVNICWKGVHFSGPIVPQEQWTKISGYYDLSDVRIRNDDQIQLYFWNNSSTDLLVDDFYFVFGAPRERIGDSARVDMTREQGTGPRFNTPPYQPFLLHKQEIGNGEGTYLIRSGGTGSGEITPADQVFSGQFISAPGDLQSMLVIKPDGKPELFHYCREMKRFVEISLECAEDLVPILTGPILMKGSFLPGGKDQLFAAGTGGMALLAFESTVAPCSRNHPGARVKVVWQSDNPDLNGIPLHQDRQLTSGDLNGDGVDELLLFEKDGSWKILRFAPGGSSGGDWREVADGKEYKVREWNPGWVEFRAIAGPFLSSSGQDLVLTIFRELKNGKQSYSLLRYLSGDGKFTEVFPDKQASAGLTLGIDTLKLTDQLLPGDFLPGKPLTFLRYNRDWRYDLKDIRFNDTTFQVLSAIDFTGYEGDRNPKYYEILKLYTGNWIDPSFSSVLVIGRNCQDPDYAGGPCETYEENPALPDMLQLYSFTPSKP